MSTASPVVRAQEEKAKKQKRVLAVLSVVLLGLMGFELPKMLGGSGSSPSASPPTTIAAESLPGSPPSVAPGTLPDTDRVTLQPGSDKLVSFGLFKSKDPFVQQLSTVATPDGLSPVAPPTGVTPVTPVVTTSQPHVPPVRSTITGRVVPATTTSSPTLTPVSTVPSPSTTPITPTPVSTTPVTTATTPGTTTPAATATAPVSVSISTNGICELVDKNGTFPGSEDIFRVVSIARDGKSAKIAVVGGAYDSGTDTVTIKLGERVTLVNTADGTRYVILMKARCDVQTSPVGAGGSTTGTTTTSPTSTVAPPTTTSTVTTPIVTDSLDTTTPTP